MARSIAPTDNPFDPTCAGLATQRMCALLFTRPGEHVRLDLAAELAETCGLTEMWANEVLRWSARSDAIGHRYRRIERGEAGRVRRTCLVKIDPEKLESAWPLFDWSAVLEEWENA